MICEIRNTKHETDRNLKLHCKYRVFLKVLLIFLASGIWHLVSAQVNPLSTSALAWTGGINAIQFCELDLNRDGIMDLLAFDRHGNRIIPLVYQGMSGSALYIPDTTYISHLPDLHDWVLTADYNCDGRMDLFTYGLGGIRVFRNTSENELRFELVTSMLTSWFYSGYIGILVTPVDYPAIADIDGDGDLDILTFFGLGSFVEYHKNLSMEKYGTCDSLDFRLKDNCWGKFKESEGSNEITLNADCPSSNEEFPMTNFEFIPLFSPSPNLTLHILESSQKNENGSNGRNNSSFLIRNSSFQKHTGSTMLAIDLNGNGLKDLVLGDVDFPNLIALYNGGTSDTAFIVAFDTLFPSGNNPVNLFDFPVPSYVDVDHDGLKDLLVSSFDPQPAVPNNYQSVWFYRNTGSSYLPKFTFQSKSLFQNQMIDAGSGSYPVFTDLDQDGMTDLLVGCWGRYDSSYYQEGLLKSVNTGRIAYFRNSGKSFNPSFSIITDDLAGLSSLELTGLYPASGDLNGDGASDMVVGQDDGTLLFLQNSASGSSIPDFLPPVWKYQGIDVGENSTPQLFDLDFDGLTDLIIGEKSGNLNYYRNTGSLDDPIFTFVTDSLGKVNVTNYQISYNGYSTPCFFRDHNSIERLLVGSEEGKVWYFADIPTDPQAVYPESQDLYFQITTQSFPIRCGWRTAPSIGNITDTSWFDLVLGNWAGGVNYFSQHDPPKVLLGIHSILHPPLTQFTIYPNPSGDYIAISFPSSQHLRAVRLEIVNLFGQTFLSKEISGDETFTEKRISTSQFPNGLYLVTLTDPTGRTTYASQKLVVSH